MHDTQMGAWKRGRASAERASDERVVHWAARSASAYAEIGACELVRVRVSLVRVRVS